MQAEAQREWRPDWPLHVGQVLFLQRHGGSDPTFRRRGRTYWLGRRTPEGPGTLAITPRPDEGEHGCVAGHAWGPGREWLLERMPALLGADDDWSGFTTDHPVLLDSRRRHPDARLGRSGLPIEALVPAIIEQKVTGQEAFAGFRHLVHRFGARAPGPGERVGLWMQPTPEEIAQIPSWEWLRMHIDPQRSRSIMRAVRNAVALSRGSDPVEFDRRLRTIPGLGVWTSAEVRVRAFGDPDAVSFGDYHVAKDAGWALTGTPFTDAEFAEFLEPYRPQRGRVPMLLGLAGHHRPRRGPRMSPRTHLPGSIG